MTSFSPFSLSLGCHAVSNLRLVSCILTDVRGVHLCMWEWNGPFPPIDSEIERKLIQQQRPAANVTVVKSHRQAPLKKVLRLSFLMWCRKLGPRGICRRRPVRASSAAGKTFAPAQWYGKAYDSLIFHALIKYVEKDLVLACLLSMPVREWDADCYRLSSHRYNIPADRCTRASEST